MNKLDLLIEMKDSQDEHVAGFTEFMLDFEAGTNKLYCFFEAMPDVIYYRPIIASIIAHENFEVYTCSNKDGVVRVQKNVSSQHYYNSAKVGYFVDKDYDPPLKNNSIYVTPVYAIENFYTNKDTVSKVLRFVFNLNKNDTDYFSCIQKYTDLQMQFHAMVLPLNAYLACYANKRARNNGIIRLNIDDKIKFPQSIVREDMSLGDIRKYTFEELDKIFSVGRQFSRKHFKKKKRAFSKVEKDEVFRGKFEMKFLISFLSKLKIILAKSNSILCKNKYTTGLSLNEATIYHELNSYATAPQCLIAYIKRIAK